MYTFRVIQFNFVIIARIMWDSYPRNTTILIGCGNSNMAFSWLSHFLSIIMLAQSCRIFIIHIATSNKNSLFGTQEMHVLRTWIFLCTCFIRESNIGHFPSYYLTTFFTIGNWRFWFWLHISLVIIVLFFYVPKCITSVVSLNCKFLKVFSFHNPWKNWASPAFGPYLECACTKI